MAVVINQLQSFYLRLLVTMSNENAIDKTIVDTYTLTVDENGVLGVVVDPVVSDNSTAPDDGSLVPMDLSRNFEGGATLFNQLTLLYPTRRHTASQAAKPPLSTVFNSQTIRTELLL